MNKSELKKIAALERQIVGEKPWQLKGERTKAPRITAETTEALENLIKQRIKDNKFDDPVRKVKPALPLAVASSSRQVEISSEKSKVGLAQLYEQELVGRVTSGEGTKEGPTRDVEKKLHSLFCKLDALVDR